MTGRLDPEFCKTRASHAESRAESMLGDAIMAISTGKAFPFSGG